MTDTTPLRLRVEALETMRETEKAAVLDLYEQHDKLKEWVGKNYMRIRALEAGATCPHIVTGDEGTSYCGLAEELANPQPTPNDRQIRSSNHPEKQDSSLVSRVALAISGIEYGLERDEEAVNWASEARAAIREVAAWLKDKGHEELSDWLCCEAER